MFDATAHKEKVDAARRAVVEAKASFDRLMKTCEHYIVCSSCGIQTASLECADERIPEFGHGSAVCTICSRNFGWYCPMSPDHTCYYYSDERKGKQVTLLSGEVAFLPRTHEADCKYESDDFCLFCGDPDERK